MGCVTPLGIGREAFWSSLIAGKSGVRRIETFDASGSPVKIAAEVPDFNWEAQLNPKDRNMFHAPYHSRSQPHVKHWMMPRSSQTI